MARNHLQPRIIVIASPKGGIGRSACAMTMSKALVGRDRKVLLIDLSPWGALAQCIDLQESRKQKIDNLMPLKASLDGLYYAQIELDASDAIISHLRVLQDYDDIIIDTLPGNSPISSELFLRADMPILMADPEPTSIRQATTWLRISFIRYIERFAENTDLARIIRVKSDSWTFREISMLLTPQEVAHFVRELSAFRCAFLLNNRRENSETLQSRALCHAWGAQLGMNIQFLGSLAYDERRWFFARSLADVTLFMREDPLVREMDEIIQKSMNDMHFDELPCLPLVDPQMHPRQFLRVSTPEEARQAYRILWEGYRRENGLVANILKRDEIAEIIVQLETAYKRSEIAPESEAAVSPDPVTRDLSNTFAAAKCTPQPCDSDAGSWLKQCREAQGMTFGQLSLKTRISSRILEKLEEMNIADIPTARLQAYLFETAKALDISFDELKSKYGIQ